MEVIDLINESSKDDNLITVEATVVTGFECLGLDECREKCEPTKIMRSKGRVILNIPIEKYEKVKSLRSVDNLYVVQAAIKDIKFLSEKDKDLEIVKDLVEQIDWKSGIGVWKNLVGFKGNIFEEEKVDETEKAKENITTEEEKKETSDDKPVETSPLDGDTLKDEEKTENDETATNNDVVKQEDEMESIEKQNGIKKVDEANNKYKKDLRGSKDMYGVEGQMVKYRVTCNRNGEHSFTSMEAARDFGGALQDKFNWTVDLSNYELEVVLNINEHGAYVCSGLTRGSLHRRNITHFTHTTLRATLCYGMLRLARPRPGDVVMDPLCGGGSISIEGQGAFPKAYHLCGDWDKKALQRCKGNVKGMSGTRPEVLSWDCTRLPLKSASIDVVVTDLPFGKRSGKKIDNRMLYKRVLWEIGRVVRPNTGRAALLTSDRNSLSQALNHTSSLWKSSKSLCVNQGGMTAYVFLLFRTSKLAVP